MKRIIIIVLVEMNMMIWKRIKATNEQKVLVKMILRLFILIPWIIKITIKY